MGALAEVNNDALILRMAAGGSACVQTLLLTGIKGLKKRGSLSLMFEWQALRCLILSLPQFQKALRSHSRRLKAIRFVDGWVM